MHPISWPISITIISAFIVVFIFVSTFPTSISGFVSRLCTYFRTISSARPSSSFLLELGILADILEELMAF